MKKYIFTSVVTVSAYITIEANSIEEATKLANEITDIEYDDRANSNLSKPDEVWIVSEIDGLPKNIELEG